MKIDIEKAAVVLIAIFVAVIAVNHFRLVNARIEARDRARISGDRLAESGAGE